MAAFRGIWTQDFWRAVSGECLATFIFVLLSLGSTLSWQVEAGKAPPADLVLISLSFGLSIATMVQCFGHISGGHVNPAVTAAMVVTRKLCLAKAVFYVLAQCVGAVTGAGVLYLVTPAAARGSLGITQVPVYGSSCLTPADPEAQPGESLSTGERSDLGGARPPGGAPHHVPAGLHHLCQLRSQTHGPGGLCQPRHRTGGCYRTLFCSKCLPESQIRRERVSLRTGVEGNGDLWPLTPNPYLKTKPLRNPLIVWLLLLNLVPTDSSSTSNPRRAFSTFPPTSWLELSRSRRSSWAIKASVLQHVAPCTPH